MEPDGGGRRAGSGRVSGLGGGGGPDGVGWRGAVWADMGRFRKGVHAEEDTDRRGDIVTSVAGLGSSSTLLLPNSINH